MGIQTPTSTQSFSVNIATSKATLSRYDHLSLGLQHHGGRLGNVSRLSNNYVFDQSKGLSASNSAIRKHIAMAAIQKTAQKKNQEDEKKTLFEVAPRINRVSKASTAGEVWQKVDFLKVGPKITAASNVAPGEIWQAIDFLEVGPKITAAFSVTPGKVGPSLTNFVQRGNQNSFQQSSSTELRMIKEKEMMQLGENNNLRKMYDYMDVNLNNHGSTIVRDVGSVITYEIDVPYTHNAHSQNTKYQSQPELFPKISRLPQAQAIANEKKILTIDMKNKFQQPNGQETHGKVHVGHPEQKADTIIKMSADTFDKLSSRELGGFKAYVTGLLSIDGKLSVLQQFDSKVVAKY